jgi:hypothetical protein
VGLKLAGALAVSPNGSLYVADVAGHRVQQSLGDGRFRDIAGNGRDGFSGDGGRATKAELSDISDLTFSPAGRLYVADGGRVRVINPNGTVHTIAGNGQAATHRRIAQNTPALSAALGSPRSITQTGSRLSIAFSQSGQLYISTGTQILRLTARGNLDAITPQITSGRLKGQPFFGARPIAITDNGSIDEGGEVGGWSIWQITPTGLAHKIAYARGGGGNNPVIQRGPGGVIYAEDGPEIVRVATHKLIPAFGFNQTIRGQYFPTRYFAFSESGALYADDVPGNTGFEAHQQLLKLVDHKAILLWQQPK